MIIESRSTGGDKGWANCVAGVLGKRKSSERDSHSSDEGYCTCGSCESTPGGGDGSTSSVSATAGCSCRKIKRNKETSRLNENSTSTGVVVPGNECVGNRPEEECVMSQARTQTAEEPDTNVNSVLDEFDSIFESPDAVAALSVPEDGPSFLTDQHPPTPATVVSSEHTAPPPRPSTPHPGGMPHPGGVPRPGGTPHPPADCHVSSSTTEQKPAVELSIGLEELAKREDEELKMAMEESLRQQVTAIVSLYYIPESNSSLLYGPHSVFHFSVYFIES